ncbi:MAG: TRAP transporter large permease subunit [Comamonadaceae bacterium]|jgi:tripartite ATP-independent transporter DctM subunit|uniref:TRAP transporter large permease protein n=1 Tax=Hydrogenophaga borbori TaxID=2294117 RepID=A0A372EPE1_9BURK|nr:MULTISPECIES: TRAP transporter large permease subunit [Hydrogenophaga]NCT95766.1 TRAP transporter large permease subunit [Comamonadaceae bacterium]RFP82489.1 TRAP transporter large permease subunit [Hydrogenophaga borbori]WQB82064.1 TRAP transporter large permease subunit [Hydrogenophaga sp. SNF1]
MSGTAIGLWSILFLVLLVYSGMHVPIVMIVVSFAGIWLIRDNLELAGTMLAFAATDSIEAYVFGVIPLFVLMGLLVMIADLGKDSFAVAHQAFRRLPGNLGIATVMANAIFAAITGVSVAAATVFSKLAVPEMIRYGYDKRFAVGVVAGSSVLGMLIPPSVLFIIYGLVTNTSVGDLFLAGIIPGIVLAVAYAALIWWRARRQPERFGNGPQAVIRERLGTGQMMGMVLPIVLLIVLVLGGLYGGVFTATESGAVGALGALVIALAKKRLSAKGLWRLLTETGHVTSSLILLIIAANVYSRMLSVSGLPMYLAQEIQAAGLGFAALMVVYLLVLLILGTLMDSASILLICVPLFLPVFQAFQVDVVWLGVITVIVVEIGLLTPPFGMAVFIVKASINDKTISLNDIFMGTLPFAAVMLAVALMVIAMPWMATAFIR